MDKIHLVMPMGGGGVRFGNMGYEMPKPLIDLQGKPFFYWAVKSIEKFVSVEDIIFAVLQDHIDRFHIDEVIKSYFPDAKIHAIPHILNGAVLTCCEATTEIDDNLPILFNDCDHAFVCKDFYSFCEKAVFDEIDGGLLTFKSSEDKFSYVSFDTEGNVIGTVEKKVVSDEAICGAYYFRNKSTFLESVETYLEACEYQEYFVSGVYNEMVKKGKLLKTFSLDEHFSYGTPEEYEFIKNEIRLDDVY